MTDRTTTAKTPSCVVIRGGNTAGYEGKQRLSYLEGVSAQSAGAKALRERVLMHAGDFVYIPAGSPHLVRNPSQTEPLVGILARTDPNEQESVVLLPHLEELVRPPSAAE